MARTGGLLRISARCGDSAIVTFWIDPGQWGRGLASAALRSSLDVEPTRPLFARVAEHNVGSAKVLRRGGFVQVGSERSWAEGLGREVG
jgi:RimJ/RimL family protein N-acetyltransferase